MTPLLVLACMVAGVLLWAFAPSFVLAVTTYCLLVALSVAQYMPRWLVRPIVALAIRVTRGGLRVWAWLGGPQ